MAETDQRSGADGRSGIYKGYFLGRTALSGCALAAVLGLAGFGTAAGATPVPVVGTTPLGGFGTLARGSAQAVDPRTILTAGQVVDPAAVAGAAVPVLPVDTLPMDTVTAASVPTPTAAVPTGTVAAPAAGIPDLAVGGTPPATRAAVPAGPAAQLRQAAFTSAAPDQRASLAIRTALAQIGLPYVWGGDGPTNGDPGFDCSGLTTFSYGSAGVLLPRTAHTQYNAGPHVPDGAALQPGDLVFYGTSARVHHVGMYVGAGRMVNAPTFGKPVQVAFYRYIGDDYLGATRPAAAGGSLTNGVLPYVDPLPAVPDVALAPAQRQQQAQERVFQAPTASLPAVLPQPGDVTLPPEQQSAAQAIAEAPARAVVPQSFVGPPAVGPPAVVPPAEPGRGSDPAGGTTTASSAPVTTSPAAPSAPAAVTTSPGTSPSSPAPTSPAGGATSATTTTAAPAAPATQAPATSSSAPATAEKASGSTTATTTLAPTSTVRATTPKTAPKAPPPRTAAKTVTAPTTAKTVTSTTKPAAKTEDDAPTTTKTSGTKTSGTKTSASKTSASKTSASKTGTSTTKTTEEKAAQEKATSEEKSSSSDGDD